MNGLEIKEQVSLARMFCGCQGCQGQDAGIKTRCLSNTILTELFRKQICQHEVVVPEVVVPEVVVPEVVVHCGSSFCSADSCTCVCGSCKIVKKRENHE